MIKLKKYKYIILNLSISLGIGALSAIFTMNAMDVYQTVNLPKCSPPGYKPFNFHGYICLEFSLIWGLAIVMVVKVFQKYVEAHALHTPATWEWIVIAVLYAVYLTDFIVTVAVIQGLNKKLTRLDKVRSDLRIVSDKLSDTLATTTIGTAQKVGEGKVQATLAAAELRDATAAQREKSIEMLRIKRAELQAQFEELSSSITNHTVVGQGRIIKAFPKMQHRDYSELIQELKKRLK